MLSKRRGLTSVALMAGLALTAAACGGGSSDDGETTPNKGENVAKGGTLKVLGEEDVSTLDTADAYDTNSYFLLRAFQRQLYSNPAGNSTEDRIANVPDLADGDPKLSNGDKTYTIKIKEGVKWNTTPARQITAQDAVRGMKMTCNPTLPFGAIGFFTDTIVGMKEFCDGFAKVPQNGAAGQKTYVEGTQISGIKAVDDTTLQIDLKAPAADFIHLLELPTLSPRPVEAMDALVGSPESKQNIIESGPYQIETYVPDKSYVFTRNPAWDPKTDELRAANVDRIEVTLGLDQESIQQQLQAGTGDIALGNEPVPPAALATLSRVDDKRLHFNPTGGQNPYMVINTIGPNKALDKLEVRQALNYAVNKKSIVQVVGGEKVAKATGQIFSESVVGEGFEAQDPYETPDSAGDPQKAKELLKTAGFPNGLDLVLAYRANGNGPKIAETLQADLAKAGIRIKPKAVPNKDFYSRFLQKNAIAKQGQWDIALPGWSPDWEGASERSFFTPLLDGRVYGEGSTNYGGYNNETVNSAADKALATTDQADSAKQWNEIDKMIMADAPWVPIFNQTQANFVSERVKNFQYAFGPSNADITQVAVQ
ncbi:MAG: hypothetical protein JWO60_296 [Frankiales bacterium]|nr:hypothetical protein [Frankiales bacterium]